MNTARSLSDQTDFPQNWEPFFLELQKYRKIMISSHVRPDGDALGSELAAAALLRSRGIEVEIVNVSPTPSNLQFLDPDKTKIQVWEPGRTARWLKQFDAILLIDTSSRGQLDAMAQPIEESGLPLLVVDHHAVGGSFDGLKICDPSADSAGSLIAEAFQSIGLNPSAEIAQALFVALCTDTGWFRFASVKPKTMETAAWLIRCGASPAQLYQQLFEQFRFPRLKMIGVVMNRAQQAFDDRVIWSSVLQEDFDGFHADHADMEGVINTLLTVKGTETAILFTELSDAQGKPFIKVNLRSRTPQVDVAALAARFGGGGHKAAAGCSLYNSTLEQGREKLFAALEDDFALQKPDEPSSSR